LTDESEIQFEKPHALFAMRIAADVTTEAYAFPKTCTSCEPVAAPAVLTAETTAASYDCICVKLDDRIPPETMTCKLDLEPLPVFATMVESDIQTLRDETDPPILKLLDKSP
jgi:hypothetical protein